MPPDLDKNPVWPYWPQRLRTSSSHEEGASRDWSVATKRFEGRNGKVEKLVAARVEWKDGKMQEIPGTEFEMKADFVLLAMASFHRYSRYWTPSEFKRCTRQRQGDDRWSRLLCNLGRQSIRRRRHAPSQSLVVWAIREGRQCARAVDEFLTAARRCRVELPPVL
jgi:glutamate synthase (NADPH/NADH) small chain